VKVAIYLKKKIKIIYHFTCKDNSNAQSWYVFNNKLLS